MCTIERELNSFKAAAVRRAAENLMRHSNKKQKICQDTNKTIRHSIFRALCVVKEKDSPDDDDGTAATTTTSPATTRTTTWVTPHGKATIVSDFLEADAETNSSSHNDDGNANHTYLYGTPAAHDLIELQWLRTKQRPTLQQEMEYSTEHYNEEENHNDEEPANEEDHYFQEPSNDDYQAYAYYYQQQQKYYQQATDPRAMEMEVVEILDEQQEQEPQQEQETTTATNPKDVEMMQAFIVNGAVPTKLNNLNMQTANSDLQKAIKSKVKLPVKAKSPVPSTYLKKKYKKDTSMPKSIVAPTKPNVYPNQKFPPHISSTDGNNMTHDELKAAWAEHYKREKIRKEKERLEQMEKEASTRVLQDQDPNTTSTTVTVKAKPTGAHLRKLPTSSANKEGAVQPTTTAEEDPQKPSQEAQTESSSQQKEQQKTTKRYKSEAEWRREQEMRRYRRREVEALEAYGVSTVVDANGSTKTSPVSTEFHTYLCWFKEKVLNGQWVMENHMNPAKGWETYVSRSILVLHLKRLPQSYLLGATMYQRPSTREWQEHQLQLQQQQQNNPHQPPSSATPPYHVSCNAMIEITKEPNLGEVTRRWTNWNSVPHQYRGTIFTYMIQKLIHTRRKGKLYQFPTAAYLEQILAAGGPVNGRDLEVVTVVLEETPEWLE